ncbi:MAG: cytosine deaminase [Acidimicrobiales bacterium]|jgi:cytosine deaminase
MQLVIRNGRLHEPGASKEGLVDLLIDDGRFAAIEPAGVSVGETAQQIDVQGAMLSAPYVEPHVHMDTCLTAGEPRWNESGTLWEGIACWSERKAMLTHEDVVTRVNEVLRWQVANGVLHVRSHVDTTDPALVALDALVDVRRAVRDVVNLQLVAFPQEGIVSFQDGEKLIAEAARRGVDVIGAIPHFEDTREDGVRSLEIAVATALDAGLLMDVHCDEIDDEQSRFVEVLATHAMRTGLRGKVTASHTTAMGSYNAAYSYKLQRILSRSGINLVCNPMVNLHLQGRFDSYPKRRGLTQVKEMLGAGVNVAFGHDDVMDPWFPMGTANPLQVAHTGALATQMTSPAQIAECFEMVTSRAAGALSLGEKYGIVAGRPASLIVLPATDPFDAVRRQVRPWYVIANGRVVAETPPVAATLSWPGEPAQKVDFVRQRDLAEATWPR